MEPHERIISHAPDKKKTGNFSAYQVGTRQELAPSRPDFPSRGETSICASGSLSVYHWSRVGWVLQGHILDCLPAKVHLPIGGIERGKTKSADRWWEGLPMSMFVARRVRSMLVGRCQLGLASTKITPKPSSPTLRSHGCTGCAPAATMPSCVRVPLRDACEYRCGEGSFARLLSSIPTYRNNNTALYRTVRVQEDEKSKMPFQPYELRYCIALYNTIPLQRDMVKAIIQPTPPL